MILGASPPFFLVQKNLSPPHNLGVLLDVFLLAMKKVQLLQRGSHLSSLPELPATHGEWGMPHGSATGCQQDLFHAFHRLHSFFRVVNSQKKGWQTYI